MQRIAASGCMADVPLKGYLTKQSWLADAPPQLTISTCKALLSPGLVETPPCTSIRAVVGIRAITMKY